jgi:hypothetical protein
LTQHPERIRSRSSSKAVAIPAFSNADTAASGRAAAAALSAVAKWRAEGLRPRQISYHEAYLRGPLVTKQTSASLFLPVMSGTNVVEVTFTMLGSNRDIRMDGHKTIGPLALQRLGEALRRQYGIRVRLPSRLYSLVEKLKRVTKEDDYLDNAADAVRLAQHSGSSSDKTHLLELAKAWVDLADKAHEDTLRPRRPTILHPLVQKKLGHLPD